MYLRLAFAVAAHLRTEIMLIDEVLAVGDAKFQRKCLGKMQDAASEGRTVIFVSHNMGAISKLCQRVLWLNQGRLELDGSTEEVVSAYSASFVTGKHTWERSSRDLGFDNQNPLWLRSVSLCQGEQENVSTVNFSKEFSVEIEYEVVRIVFDASIVLRVNSESGTVIFTSIDTDLSENLTSFERTPGRHVAVCRIPGSFLRSGSYSITFGVRRQGIWSELHDHLLRFEVDAVNNPLHPARQGVITPILEWNDYIMEQ
jgi:lipopolysaccharide transport system ATP-binding protein